MPDFVGKGCFVRCFSDGGSRKGGGGAGYLVEVAEKNSGELDWQCVLETSLYIGSANGLSGEIVGSLQGLLACHALCTHKRIMLDARHYVLTDVIDWSALVVALNMRSSRSEVHERASMLHIHRMPVQVKCAL